MAEKITYEGAAPSKEMKDGNGKVAFMFMGKLAGQSKTVHRIVIPSGWDWATGARPHIPGCPEWCPATHFGCVKCGSIEVMMKDDNDKFVKFDEGDAYYIPPGHMIKINKDTELMEFSQDQILSQVAGEKAAEKAPEPKSDVTKVPMGKISYTDKAPNKTMKDANGKTATATVMKFANGEKIVNRIVIQEGFDWATGVKPCLPGCPDWCPATHFGFIAKGKMDINMKGTNEWISFGPGDSYHISPGHLPKFSGGETVMMEFSNDPTYTNDNFLKQLNFYVIEHTFKAGKAEEWWGNFAKIMGEPDGMAKMTKAQHDNGFHNHSFLPGMTADGIVHCVWEAAPGKTAADMQAFIDGEVGPSMGCMDNVVLGPVDASQAQLGYMSYFANNTAIATEPIKGSTIYMVQHHIKPGKGEALFANMGKIMSEPGAQEGMDEKLKAQGFKNHSFFPLQGKTEGLFACCIWEAKEGLGVADVEKMMENHWGVGGFCDNKVFAIDCTKAMVGLSQKFAPHASAIKGAAPSGVPAATTKSVA